MSDVVPSPPVAARSVAADQVLALLAETRGTQLCAARKTVHRRTQDSLSQVAVMNRRRPLRTIYATDKVMILKRYC